MSHLSTPANFFPFEVPATPQVKKPLSGAGIRFVPPPPPSIAVGASECRSSLRPSIASATAMSNSASTSAEVKITDAPQMLPNMYSGMRYVTSDGFTISMFSHSYSVEYPISCGPGGLGRLCWSNGNSRVIKFGASPQERTYARAVEYLNLLNEQATRNFDWAMTSTSTAGD